jgi:glycosyltransferase involved in cell wall biosynthesis
MRTNQRSSIHGVLARIHGQLHGRSIGEAGRDLRRLYATHGVAGLLQRTGYFSRPPDPPLGPEVQRDPWLHTHAWGSAHNPHFDLTPEVLESNRRVVEAFEQRGEVRSATWFLAHFDHALFGGVYTILRLMSWMKEVHGVEHRLVIVDRLEVTDQMVRTAISEVFPNLGDIDIVLPFDGRVPYDELPSTDIGVCTLWVTAYALARFNAVKSKFYMVQDFEPSFYAAGTLYALTEATYRLGFAGIGNTSGPAAAYESYGNPTISFTPAFDVSPPDLIKPSALPGAPAQVVLYGRPTTERNAFELLAAACRKIKTRYGERVRIVSAGEVWEPSAYQLDGIVENRGLLGTLEEVRTLYEASDIGLSFMLTRHPSYQPFEYLAAKAAPVSNVNANTSWFLRDGENSLVTDPFPSCIAAAVGRLIDEPELRRKIVETGYAQVADNDWPSQLDRVWRFISNTQ